MRQAIVPGGIRVEEIGAWQQVFKRTCSERIKKALARTVRTPEFCLERARAEIKALEQYKDEPRIIQRARILEIYLREKNISILEDELIVGNVTGKVRASPIFGEMYARFLDSELDDPVRDFAARKYDPHVITPEERKELRETIIPYFKGKTIEDYSYRELADDEVKGKAFILTASCHHIPNLADLKMDQDAGHQLANYEKVLRKGLRGIREEVEWYIAQLEEPYEHYAVQQRRDFYRAVLIMLDAKAITTKRTGISTFGFETTFMFSSPSFKGVYILAAKNRSAAHIIIVFIVFRKSKKYPPSKGVETIQEGVWMGRKSTGRRSLRANSFVRNWRT